VQYPFENGLGDLPLEDNFACLKGLVDAWIARDRGLKKPDNFADWIDYRMGKGIGEKFMRPYNEKIWKCDLSEMGIAWWMVAFRMRRSMTCSGPRSACAPWATRTRPPSSTP
jgi:protoporphyrinogen oxidase